MISRLKFNYYVFTPDGCILVMAVASCIHRGDTCAMFYLKRTNLSLIPAWFFCQSAAFSLLGQTDSPIAPERVPGPMPATSEAQPASPFESALQAVMDRESSFRASAEKKFFQTFELIESEREPAQSALSSESARMEMEIEQGYNELIQKFPDEPDAYVWVGNYYNSLGQDHRALEFWESALKLAPDDPAIWNNIAGYYTHNGDIRTSFEYFQKAVSLPPANWVHFHNFANAVFLFRPDAMEYFQLSESQVFDKAFMLYDQALALDPHNFELARDIANSFYIVRPQRIPQALIAWKRAQDIADSETRKQDALIHIARWHLKNGDLPIALKTIDDVTLPEHADLKKRVKKNILKSLGNPE
jgi:tetratricopeptide (TPR) repeat protein